MYVKRDMIMSGFQLQYNILDHKYIEVDVRNLHGSAPFGPSHTRPHGVASHGCESCPTPSSVPHYVQLLEWSE